MVFQFSNRGGRLRVIDGYFINTQTGDLRLTTMPGFVLMFSQAKTCSTYR